MADPVYAEDVFQAIVTFEDEDGALYDPSSVEIYVLNGEGEQMQGGAPLGLSDLTRTAEGVYRLAWQLPADAEAGAWCLVVVGYSSPLSLERTKRYYFTCGGSRV